MNFKIIVDSCCELPQKFKKDKRFASIPLSIEVGGEQIIDDETFDQLSFIEKVAKAPECPKSACPSPDKYMEAYNTDAENIFVFTLSSKLSGSYNSAELGKQLYKEEHEDKNIFVCDSESASVGETQLALCAVKWAEEGFSFKQICEKLKHFRDEMKTYFVLDNLETMRKNGRMSRVRALVASTLSIKPILGSDKGEIVQIGQAVGIKKALSKMVDNCIAELDSTKKTLMISHCNCLARAEYVRDLILAKCNDLEIIILDMAGISSMYANEGGVIITV